MNIDRICEIIGIAAIVSVILLFVSMFCSCKTVDCIPETIVKDSIRVEQRLDSIYLYEKDSVFIHQKADTVWLEKYITRYKDVLKVERDTIYQDNTIVEVKEVVVEKPIAGITKWFAWIGVAAVLYVLIRIALFIYKKFWLK